MCDDGKLRERIEGLIAPTSVRDDISGETRQVRPPVHIRTRDLRRILDIAAVPDVREEAGS